MIDKYNDLTIEQELKKSLKSVKRTRSNRINLSNRLNKYYQRWKFALLVLNFEAVFLIIKSLSTTSPTDSESQLIGFFSIYVILLQYFINEQNYNERSMKSHYHQLELKDIYLQLKNMLIKLNLNNENDEKLVKDFQSIMDNYQMMLKNNENHSSKDDIIRELEKDMYNPKKLDFSWDNILIVLNYIIAIIILISIIKFVVL